jgi:alkylation response protein AidB-like acyl-CoA dehydrogenase
MTAHGPEMLHAFMRVDEVAVHDTWFVSGLCGTGSHDVSARDVFVPEQRLFLVADGAHTRPEPLYRLPALGWFVAHVAAASLGMARGALDELMDLAPKKKPTMSQVVLADKPAAQIELARAEATLGASRAFLHDAVEQVWQAVKAGQEPTPRQRAFLRMACAQAAETGAAVTRTAHVLAGGGAILASSPLQRHMRDADALAHHFTVSPHVWEDAGRVLLGRPTTAPMF